MQLNQTKSCKKYDNKVHESIHTPSSPIQINTHQNSNNDVFVQNENDRTRDQTTKPESIEKPKTDLVPSTMHRTVKNKTIDNIGNDVSYDFFDNHRFNASIINPHANETVQIVNIQKVNETDGSDMESYFTTSRHKPHYKNSNPVKKQTKQKYEIFNYSKSTSLQHNLVLVVCLTSFTVSVHRFIVDRRIVDRLVFSFILNNY